ncbi:ArnT family glycosyltransferase [Nodosilinea sp. PGN35]|uniref:ArnT family glycosyltransferase n=1 Tax=Nodosilinea sp. PGN35 TaxID=3020489 RepID=UPI0023B2A5F7|nr:glycosyltransferase family 39 protein [Nodosilinea sp. TSF1-S3]MDF0367738.1 glycosyltransferase family 39 protein [Nodosilinea sp. TSF1-S3]
MAGWSEGKRLALSDRKPSWAPGLLALVLGGLLYRAIVAVWLFPGFDEAYYYLYSRYLSLSYFDHPPMVALTTGLGWWLTGVISPFTIRLGALVLYCFSLGLLYLAATRLFSRAVGQMTVAIVTLIPLFAIGFGILTSPDNGLIFFWSATLLVAAWEFFPQDNRLEDPREMKVTYGPTWRVVLLGLTVALAGLSKYHGFVLGVSLVGFCAAYRPYRAALRSPWTLLALLVFLLTLFPLWYWNSQNDWISFRFQLGMRFDGTASPSGFSLGQMVGYWLLSNVYLFPLIGFPLWWVAARQGTKQALFWRSPNRSNSEVQEHYKRGLVLWLSLPIMLLFTLLGGKQQILPAWPAPGYWGMVILLSAQVLVWQQHRPRLMRRWLWGSGLFLGSLSVVALLHLQLGVLQKPSTYALFGGLLPVDQDGSTELIDTSQLQRQFASNPEIQAALREVGFVFTNEYYLGGYFAMAIHPLVDLPVTAFSQDPRGFAFWFDPQEWIGKDALYMTLDRFAQDDTLVEGYRPLFDSMEPLATVPIMRGGEVTETIHLYRANGLRQTYPYPYGPSAGALPQSPAGVAEQGRGG